MSCAVSTAEWNLSAKSRRCHLAKHHGWHVTRNPTTGTSTWTSPLGNTYQRPTPWRGHNPLPPDDELPPPRLILDNNQLTPDGPYDKPLPEGLAQLPPKPTKAKAVKATPPPRTTNPDEPPF